MGSEVQGPRSYELVPRGPQVAGDAVHLLARSAGELVGAGVGGAVCTWLVKEDGQLVLMMWPASFRARFDPLEVLDDRGQVVALGGEFVTVGGGYLKQGDPRSLDNMD